jgi:type I site-specific restriction-modification system R (restriction) subunit
LGEDNAMQEAQAAVEIQQAIEQAIPPEFLEIMAKAFEQAQSLQPPMPQDPTMAAVEVQKQMIQQRAASDQMKIEANQQHDQLQAQQAQQKLEADALEQQQKDAAAERKQARQEQVDILLETLRQDREDQRKQAEIAAKLQVNADDNETAKQLAAAEILSGERLAMTTGNNINPNS